MSRNKRLLVLGVVIVAIAAVSPAAVRYFDRSAPPRSLDDAGKRMKEKGLNIVSWPNSAVTGSTEPLNHDSATNLGPASDWTGKVRAWPSSYDAVPEAKGAKTVRWGDVLLSGDPAVVDRLVGKN